MLTSLARLAGAAQVRVLLTKSFLEKDHNGAPHDHGNFGQSRPLRRPPKFVGAPDNSDYSSENVGKRYQEEANGQSIGQTNRDRRYGGARRHDICDRAIGDSILPKGLAERDVTSPECCQMR